MKEADDDYKRRLDMIDDHIKGLQYRNQSTQESIKRLADAQEQMSVGMTKLTEILVNQERDRRDLNQLFTDVRSIGERVQKVEVVMPQLVESRGWVVKWIIGIVTAVTVAVVSFDLHKVLGGK